MTIIDIGPGAVLNTHAFGKAFVTKVYTHKETRETVLDVKSEAGDNLHLSFAYARTLLHDRANSIRGCV